MSLLIRSALVLLQALSNHLAFLPPHKTPAKGRYHTEEAYVLQIAPLIFKLHSVLLWCIAAFELIFTLNCYFNALISPLLSVHMNSAVCPASRPHILTPLFLLGVVFTVSGAIIRLQCFQELGHLFTFDLSIFPDHKLVTSGYYGYVRHPAYTGSMLIVIGVAFSQLSAGSVLVECTVLGSKGSGLLWTVWWAWTFSVGISRAIAEDKELRKMFGSKWDSYAASTKFWFVPGLL